MLERDSVLLSLLRTCLNLFLGYTPAVLIGLLLGGLIGWNRVLYEIGKRLFQLPASIPYVIYIPIGIAVLRLQRFDSTLGSILVGISSVWLIAIHTAIGIQDALQNGRQWRLVIPHIFLGLRFGLMIAWTTILFTEMLVGSSGIGFYIWDAYNAGNDGSLKRIVDAAIVVSIAAFIFDQLLDGCSLLLQRMFRPTVS